MKQLVSTIGDRLQALFPPNRLMLVLAGPITAGSIWLSAWITANVPGVELPVGVIAGAMGLVGLVVVTLIYKWFDRWQKVESFTVDKELDQVFAELDQATEEVFDMHDHVIGVSVALQDLHDRIAKGSINEAEIAKGVAGILGAIGQYSEESPAPVPPVEEPIPLEEPIPPAPPGE